MSISFLGLFLAIAFAEQGCCVFEGSDRSSSQVYSIGFHRFVCIVVSLVELLESLLRLDLASFAFLFRSLVALELAQQFLISPRFVQHVQ